jgi:hypothetical protein
VLLAVDWLALGSGGGAKKEAQDCDAIMNMTKLRPMESRASAPNPVSYSWPIEARSGRDCIFLWGRKSRELEL